MSHDGSQNQHKRNRQMKLHSVGAGMAPRELSVFICLAESNLPNYVVELSKMFNAGTWPPSD